MEIDEGMQGNLTVEEIFEGIRQVYPTATVPDSAKQDVERVWHQLRRHILGS